MPRGIPKKGKGKKKAAVAEPEDNLFEPLSVDDDDPDSAAEDHKHGRGARRGANKPPAAAAAFHKAAKAAGGGLLSGLLGEGGALFDDNSSGEESDVDPRSRLAPARSDGRLASVFWENIGAAGHTTALAFVRSTTWSNIRSFHEARRNAQVFDALRLTNVPLTHDAMEMLLRNLVGLQTADARNNLALLDEFEFAPVQDVCPRDVLRTILRDHQRNHSLASMGTGGGGRKHKPAPGTPSPPDKGGKGAKGGKP
jgi:hypothetical protein